MPTSAPIHLQLATAWGLEAEGADLVRRCLVLAADHELNTATYVARCVASTAASPYAVVIAVLSALSGPRHGGQNSQVESVLRELLGAQDIVGALTARLQREGMTGFAGERIPGFGHPLYPNGDPRAINILNALASMKQTPRSSAVLRMGHQISNSIGRQQNIDFALAAVSVALDLPRGAGLGLLLVGRAVGWIAHAIEQYAIPTLIRPRARYVGVLPSPDLVD
jgi:citrate synthase